MLKALIIAACVASVSVAATGCTKDANSADDANSNQSPLDQLKAIPDDLNKEVDGIMQPITDIDFVVEGLQSMPAKLGVSPKDFKAAIKGAYDSGEAKVTLEVKPEQKADLDAFVAKAAGIPAGIKAIPDKVAAFLPKLASALVKIPTLAGAATAKLTVTANSPFGNADEKAKAKADLADLDKVKADVTAKIDEIKKKVTDLKEKGPAAAAKITAAFAG